MRVAALAAGLVMLAGCSEMFDHRDTIAVGGGNALYANRVTQMVDPWPRASANRDIAFDGNTMEAAYTRYRTGKVIQPVGTGTGTTHQAPPPAPTNTAPVGPTITQPAAAVK
jgi:hypothetical protein